MNDLVILGIMLLFTLVTVGYLELCDRLQGR